MAANGKKIKKLDLKTKKGKLILFSAIAAAVTVAVVVAVPVALLVPGNAAQAPSTPEQTPLTPEQEREAFLAKYPGSLEGNTVTDMAFSGYVPGYINELPEDFALPSFVEEIGQRAFLGSVLPAKFVLPPNLKKIHTYAFVGADLPADFTIPDSVYYIGSDAFLAVTFKKRLVLPSALTDLGINHENPLFAFAPFAGATFENGIVLPDTLVFMADNTFKVSDPPELEGTAGGLSAGITLIEKQSMVQVGFKIPANVQIGTYSNGSWHYASTNTLKVDIPPDTKWDNPNGAVAGATVVPDTNA